MKARWCFLGLVCVLALGVWLLISNRTTSVGYRPSPDSPRNFPTSKVVRDDRPAFTLDAAKPWKIEFGRGGGWHGLDTVKLDHEGRLVLHRLREDGYSWESAASLVPADAVAKVREAVAKNRLLELEKAYHANVADGTQWVLWVRQEQREKSIYFDNHFPDPIIRFADELDEILSASVGPGLKWGAASAARSHERELWDSIK